MLVCPASLHHSCSSLVPSHCSLGLSCSSSSNNSSSSSSSSSRLYHTQSLWAADTIPHCLFSHTFCPIPHPASTCFASTPCPPVPPMVPPLPSLPPITALIHPLVNQPCFCPLTEFSHPLIIRLMESSICIQSLITSMMLSTSLSHTPIYPNLSNPIPHPYSTLSQME